MSWEERFIANGRNITRNDNNLDTKTVDVSLQERSDKRMKRCVVLSRKPMSSKDFLNRALFLVSIFLIATLWGCSVEPSESTVAETIIDYFKSGQYRVLNLSIGKIEGMTLSEKKYMGTPGYVVDIVSITLEPQVDRGIDIKQGKAVTFSNAKVRIIQDTANKNLWHVFILSGIALP